MNGWFASVTSTVLKPRVRSSPSQKDLQLVHALHVEVEGAAGAVDLPLERVAASERETRRLDRPDRRRSRTRLCRLDRVRRTFRPLTNVFTIPGDRAELADEVAREVDDVRSEIAERAGSRWSGSKRHVSSVGSSPQSCR